MSDPQNSPSEHPAPGGGRRQWHRYPRNGDSACIVGANGTSTYPVEVQDISAGVVSLVFSRRRAEGDRLTLRLYSPSRDRWSEHELCVMYCLEHPEGYYLAGGAFARELTEDELRALL